MSTKITVNKKYVNPKEEDGWENKTTFELITITQELKEKCELTQTEKSNRFIKMLQDFWNQMNTKNN